MTSLKADILKDFLPINYLEGDAPQKTVEIFFAMLEDFSNFFFDFGFLFGGKCHNINVDVRTQC